MMRFLLSKISAATTKIMSTKTLFKKIKIMHSRLIMIFIIRSLILTYFLKRIGSNFGRYLTQLMLLILDPHLVLDRSCMICICFKQIISYSLIKAQIFIQII